MCVLDIDVCCGRFVTVTVVLASYEHSAARGEASRVIAVGRSSEQVTLKRELKNCEHAVGCAEHVLQVIE